MKASRWICLIALFCSLCTPVFAQEEARFDWYRRRGSVAVEAADETVIQAMRAALRDVHRRDVAWDHRVNYYVVRDGESVYRVWLGAAGEGTAYVRGPEYDCWEVKRRSVPTLQELLEG